MRHDDHQTSLATPAYRPDIDGLRAIAVMSVVIFHAFPAALKGGFIGVDVFFVISGYLISTIILSRLQDGSFDPREFYARRIRRIFPALIVVLLTCYVAGWLVLFVTEFRQLGRHIGAAAIFISNLTLFQETGYFDNASATKPLLHLWSLGIEEQFYLFLPGILWFFRDRAQHLTGLSIAAAISLGLGIWASSRYPSAAFYLPHNRVWELLAGSILAELQLRPLRFPAGLPGTRRFAEHLASVGGIVVLAIGFVFTDERNFPGWWALLPVGGAILLLAAGPSAICNRTVLSSRAMVCIGLISFPLYLWHWPLLAFARIVAGQTPRPQVQTIAVCLSVALATLTYLGMERPIRVRRPMPSVTIALYAALIAVGLVGYNVVIQDGFPDRAAVRLNDVPEQAAGTDQANFINRCGIPPDVARTDFRICVQDTRGTPRYALLGDSKAQSAYKGFFRSSTDAGRWMFIGGAGGAGYPRGPVLPNLTASELQHGSQTVSSIAIEAVADNPDITTVIFANAIRNFFLIDEATYAFDYGNDAVKNAVLNGYDNTAQRLARAGKTMVIVVDNPTRPDPINCATRHTGIAALDRLIVAIRGSDPGRCHLSIADHEARTRTYRDLLSTVAAHNPNVRIFDPTDDLCDRSAGACFQSKDNTSLYSYADHISDYAAFLIGQRLNAFLKQTTSP